MMTLFRVEIAPPPGLSNEPAEPIFVDTIRPAPAIRTPFEGDRFRVTDDWGREHSGVISMVEDLGVGAAADVLGADRARKMNILEHRVLHLRIVPHRPTLNSVRYE